MGPITRLTLAVIGFLVLCATNVLTLTNDSFHLKAHDLLRSSLGGIIPMDGSTINRTRQLRESNQAPIVANQRLTAAVFGMRTATLALSAAHELLRVKTMNLVGVHKSLLTKTSAIKIGAKVFLVRAAKRLAIGIARGVASLVPRVTPVLGVATSVAVMTFEVADACEMVKDLNKFSSVLDEPVQDESKVCGVRIPTAEEILEMISIKPSKTCPSPAGSPKNPVKQAR